jgi:hypothetical protein
LLIASYIQIDFQNARVGNRDYCVTLRILGWRALMNPSKNVVCADPVLACIQRLSVYVTSKLPKASSVASPELCRPEIRQQSRSCFK